VVVAVQGEGEFRRGERAGGYMNVPGEEFSCRSSEGRLEQCIPLEITPSKDP
jgi:hypothetical protein